MLLKLGYVSKYFFGYFVKVPCFSAKMNCQSVHTCVVSGMWKIRHRDLKLQIMHPSRDRLPRPVDISSLLQNAERRVDLVVDEPGLHWMGLSTPNASTAQSSGETSKLSKQRVGMQRTRHRRRYVNRSLVGKENQRPRSVRKGLGRGSVLPSWYPRTPLRDITAIVRAIERKRAQLLDDQTREASQQEADASTSNNQLDDENNSTPIPEACKVKDDNADKKGKDTAIYTPRKKLLNSIEEVRHIWLEDQRKIEKTPAAKKAERQKMVRVLMSMR